MKSVTGPALRSWIDVPAGSDFPLQNIPFGIMREGGRARAASRIGDTVIDLQALAESGALDKTGVNRKVFAQSSLNSFIASGKTITCAVRERLMDLMRSDNAQLSDAKDRL